MEENNNHIEEDLDAIDGQVEEGEYLEENEGDIQVVLTDNDGQNVDLDEEMDDASSVTQEGEEQLTQDDSIQRFLGHSDSVYSVALSPNADFSNPATTIAVTGGGDDKAFIWNASTGEKIFELSGHTDSVNSVAFNFDGKMVATGSLDGFVKVWDTQTGILVATLEGPQKEIEFVTWHSKGNFLVAGSADGTAWMWLPVKPETVIVFAGHSGAVTCGSFSQDGKTLVTGSEDGKVKIWDPKTGQTIRTIEGHNFHQGPIYCLQTTSNGLAITGSEDGTAKIANLSTGKVLGSLGGHDASVETVGISSVLPLAATGATDNKLNIYDLNSLQLRVTCTHEDSVTRLLWHPTQPLIYTASVDKCVRMWDARNGQCVKTWNGHNNAILDLAISRDGNYLLSGSDDQASLVFKV